MGSEDILNERTRGEFCSAPTSEKESCEDVVFSALFYFN